MAASEASTKYKLTYFALPGRTEAIRACLVVAQEDFEDKRITNSEWGELKPNTRWGSLPTLELEDGTVLGQSKNILRYVGRMTGYYPFHDPKRAASVDEIIYVIDDISSGVANCGKNLEDEARNAKRTEFITTGAGGKLLEKLDKFIEEKSGGKYAIGHTLTIADMSVWSLASTIASGFFDGIATDCAAKHENIQKIRYEFAKRGDMAKYLHQHYAGDEGKFSAFCHIDADGTQAPPPIDEAAKKSSAATEDEKAEEEVAEN